LDWAADGRSLVFSSFEFMGSTWRLWRVPVSGGASAPLAFGESGSRPTVSRKGGRLAYVRAELYEDIWRVEGPAASEEDRSPTRLISSTQGEHQPRYSPDGRQIAFGSTRSGAGEVWVCDSDGSNPRQVTFLGFQPSLPNWSPDGQRIAFSSRKEGNPDVYVVSVSGGVPKRLTTGPGPDWAFSWSRDGRWVYFASYQPGRVEAWKVPAEGGDALQVTTRGGTQAVESHDGRFVYFSKAPPCGAPPGVWRLPRDGGEEVQVLDRGTATNWDLLEQGIVFADCGPGPPTLELFDFATGEVSRVAVLANRAPPHSGLSVSPDGRWVLYTALGMDEADIMLVEDFR
jgi:Tol biopolymer transport system component